MESISAGLHFQAYTPYGYSPQAGMAVLGFNGGWVDRRINAYPLGNGYRFYSPSLSRFMSSDSSSPFAAGGINAYCYCLGDPVNRHDPTGHVSQLWARAMSAFRRSRIQRLPNEMLEQIAKHLPEVDLIAFASSSKRMHKAASRWREAAREQSRGIFMKKFFEEPSIQDKMVFALRVTYGREKSHPPRSAVVLDMTRGQMDDVILGANRKHYEPQVTAAATRQAIREELLRPALVHRAHMQGIR